MKYLTSIFFFLCSCKDDNLTKTIYTFNNCQVTRLDENRTSYFYYGNFKGDKPDTTIPHIKSKYHLGSNFMDGYLVFKEKAKVVLVKVSSNFNEQKKDSLFSIFEFKENPDFIHWQDSVRTNCNNIIRISDDYNLEENFNKKSKSKVIISRLLK